LERAHAAVAYGFRGRLAVLFITDPERGPADLGAVLQDIYGLTPAEADVAQSLAEGLSLDQIGDIRARSRNTIKSQTISAMAKMDVSRQAEVVRLILLLAQRRA
jgi:DNA-binding CsgD family transcriptional regulator